MEEKTFWELEKLYIRQKELAATERHWPFFLLVSYKSAPNVCVKLLRDGEASA